MDMIAARPRGGRVTPELIMFDCDGVLIDSEVIACSADAEVLTQLGFPFTTQDIIRRFAGMPSAEMFAEIEREFGRPLPPDLDLRIQDRVLSRFREELCALPDVAETVAALPWRSCVVSNSMPSKLGLGLIETRLYELFYPNIFSAALVERGKPAPDLFLYAAKEMGVRPERCIVVEDSVAGVMGARAAGMLTLGFVGGTHCPDDQSNSLRGAGAELVFDSFAQLPGLIGHLSGGALAAQADRRHHGRV